MTNIPTETAFDFITVDGLEYGASGPVALYRRHMSAPYS